MAPAEPVRELMVGPGLSAVLGSLLPWRRWWCGLPLLRRWRELPLLRHVLTARRRLLLRVLTTGLLGILATGGRPPLVVRHALLSLLPWCPDADGGARPGAGHANARRCQTLSEKRLRPPPLTNARH